MFYHRMTNGTLTSRRACVERIEILPVGTIPPVEMTSLGFQEALNPYEITAAELACVLKGGCMITEKDPYTRPITNICSGAVIGYKYFEFSEDESGSTMKFSVRVSGTGWRADIHILLDDYEKGREIGVCRTGPRDGEYTTTHVEAVAGRHAVFFKATHAYEGWYQDCFLQRHLFDTLSFVFMK